MVSLQEIVDEKKLIIVDGSIKETSSFLWNIYGIKSFGDLDLESIDSEIDYMENFLELIRIPELKTIPGVTNEIKAYLDGVITKISYLSKIENGKNQGGFKCRKIKKSRRKNKRDSWENSQGNEDGKQKLEELRQALTCVYKEFKRSD